MNKYREDILASDISPVKRYFLTRVFFGVPLANPFNEFCEQHYEEIFQGIYEQYKDVWGDNLQFEVNEIPRWHEPFKNIPLLKKIKIPTYKRTTTKKNFIVKIKGRKDPEIVLNAHYDGSHYSIYDNRCSVEFLRNGLENLLESGEQPEDSYTFAFWASEEAGKLGLTTGVMGFYGMTHFLTSLSIPHPAGVLGSLFFLPYTRASMGINGSSHYLSSRDDVENIKAWITLDMIATGDEYRLLKYVMGPKTLEALFPYKDPNNLNSCFKRAIKYYNEIHGDDVTWKDSIVGGTSDNLPIVRHNAKSATKIPSSLMLSVNKEPKIRQRINPVSGELEESKRPDVHPFILPGTIHTTWDGYHNVETHVLSRASELLNYVIREIEAKTELPSIRTIDDAVSIQIHQKDGRHYVGARTSDGINLVYKADYDGKSLDNLVELGWGAENTISEEIRRYVSGSNPLKVDSAELAGREFIQNTEMRPSFFSKIGATVGELSKRYGLLSIFAGIILLDRLGLPLFKNTVKDGLVDTIGLAATHLIEYGGFFALDMLYILGMFKALEKIPVWGDNHAQKIEESYTLVIRGN